MYLNPFEKPTVIDKQLLTEVLSPGKIAVDATCGNGHDTVFLAEQVGAQGLVYAFDVQTAAIESTANRVDQKGLASQVRLIQDSHEKIAEYVKQPVDGIMFNLGYLPGSDKSVVTEPRSTLSALESGMTLLKPGGVMSVIIYPGHNTGAQEAQKVEEFMAQIDQNEFKVITLKAVNFTNHPPYLIAAYKQASRR